MFNVVEGLCLCICLGVQAEPHGGFVKTYIGGGWHLV